MTREELEHAIRAACDVAQDDEVYVFGSQAILGQFPDAPSVLRQSAEADIAPVHAIDMVDVIDANLGALSQFHTTHGFYVHGVSLEAAVLPEGWRRRAIKVRNANTNDSTGWCVEAHDDDDGTARSLTVPLRGIAGRRVDQMISRPGQLEITTSFGVLSAITMLARPTTMLKQATAKFTLSRLMISPVTPGTK